jgi:hypothetical protein
MKQFRCRLVKYEERNLSEDTLEESGIDQQSAEWTRSLHISNRGRKKEANIAQAVQPDFPV